jgi:hypothetical protein
MRNSMRAGTPASEACGMRTQSVLDCGGKRSATPLSQCRTLSSRRWFQAIPKRRRRRAPVFAALRLGKQPAQSKTSLLALLCFFILHSSFCLRALGQYSIDWHTVDGGGGTCIGGVYSVNGTIGQPDAGTTMTNWQYAVTGGFWALHAVQTPGAPTLTIVPATAGQATISWTPATAGFVLQQSASLAPADWTNAPSGATNPLSVPATLPARFYRLHKP